MAKLALCPRCGGHGTHANPSLDGMTGEDLDEMGPERDEFIEEYTRRGGMYDVICERCHGEKTVPRCKGTDAHERVCLAAALDIDEVEHCDNHLTRREEQIVQEELEYRALVAAERRAGC